MAARQWSAVGAWLLLVTLLTGWATAQDTDSVADRRARIMKVAQAYATHRWQASADNVFHGEDEDGVRVDTPDRSFHERGWLPDGSWNVGVPYQWGGFSSLEQFDAGLREGRYAGHLHQKKANPGSGHAVGVDCSGFVSRCWGLPNKQSTRTLGSLCYPLEDWDALEPGDILNRFDAHVMLFQEYVDAARTQVRVIEAVAPCVMVNERSVAKLKADGYQAMRYRPLDPRWRQDSVRFVEASFEAAPDATLHWQADAGGAALMDPLAEGSALHHADPGDWVSYRQVDGDAEAEGHSLAGLVRLDGGNAFLHTRNDYSGSAIDQLLERDGAASLAEGWLHTVISSARATDWQRHAFAAEAGEVTWGGRTFEAVRLSLEAGMVFRVDRHAIPATVTLDGYWSPEVPLDGLLQASLFIEVDGREEPIDLGLELTAFRDVVGVGDAGSGS